MEHHQTHHQSLSGGFTLVELLLVGAIIAILLTTGYRMWRTQLERGNDIRRKTDLAKIKTALEEFYNDNQCYPAAVTCGGTMLAPGINAVPCDPVLKISYPYLPVNDTSGRPCAGYRLFTTLYDTTDLDIARVGCSAVGCGCNPPGNAYVYGVSTGVHVSCP